MKYNININQKELSKFDIDLKDCAIFTYCKDMCSSVNEKIDKERYEGHTWINYERLIEDMPLLRIKGRNSITPRIKKLEKEGLITVKDKMVKGHRRVFVRMTTLSDSVFVEMTERVRENEKRVRETVQEHYTSDNSTNDNNTNVTTPSFSDEDLHLSRMLLEKVKTNFPKTKEPNLKSWAEEIRKLREIDGFTADEIELLINWIQGGEYRGVTLKEHDFWSANIRSTAKLRKHAQQLTAQLTKDYKKSTKLNVI